MPSGEKWGKVVWNGYGMGWLGMFMGEYQHNIDDKGRVIIPAKFRDELGASFIITRGLDKSLFVYPIEEWKQIEQKLKTLPFTRGDARKFTRFFFSGAIECEIDKQGRVIIPNNLRTYSSLEKECVFIGVSNRVEIWSKDIWESYYQESEDSFNEIAEKIVDLDL